jgi:hypothetical protein
MAIAILAALAMGAAPAASSQPAVAPCGSPGHRAFDFWIGAWEVRTTDGKLAGMNAITREYGGCVIHEHYTTGHGYSGESLNIYDAPRKLWHQSWVDSSGLLLVLEGGMRSGKMVLEGQVTGADAQVTRHRITWTPNPDGSVRQLWESTDAKGKWLIAFDGKYTRK